MTSAPLTIVIKGGGIAGWLSACALAPQLGHAIAKIFVDDDGGPDESLGLVSPVEIALPATLEMFACMGISEADLIRNCGATIHLGQAITSWQGGDETQFIPSGSVIAPLGPVSFHHLALRLGARSQPIRLSDYSLEAMCAQSGRFGPASANPRSVLSTIRHGLHIETAGLCALAKQLALSRGAQQGQGQNNPGDFVLDCTGPNRVVSTSAFEDWSHLWPMMHYQWTSRAVTSPSPPLYVHTQATVSGWSQSLWTRGGENQLHAISDKQADAPRLGRLHQPWHENVVAIGGSAAMLSPSAGLGLHAVLSGLDQLIAHLPRTADMAVEANEYNRVVGAQLDHAHTWSALPFALNNRAGQPFWDHARRCRAIGDLDALLQTWSRLGRLRMLDGDWFDEQAWIASLWAHGALPARYDQVANGIPIQAIESHFEKIRSVMLTAIGTLPSHCTYLQSVLAS
jgi:tryptophan 7-halogenase